MCNKLKEPILKNVIVEIFSYIRATMRLFVLTILFIIEGLHHIYFNRKEVILYELFFGNLKSDLDKISLVDRLNSTYGSEEEQVIFLDEDGGEGYEGEG